MRHDAQERTGRDILVGVESLAALSDLLPSVRENVGHPSLVNDLGDALVRLLGLDAPLLEIVVTEEVLVGVGIKDGLGEGVWGRGADGRGRGLVLEGLSGQFLVEEHLMFRDHVYLVHAKVRDDGGEDDDGADEEEREEREEDAQPSPWLWGHRWGGGGPERARGSGGEVVGLRTRGRSLSWEVEGGRGTTEPATESVAGDALSIGRWRRRRSALVAGTPFFAAERGEKGGKRREEEEGGEGEGAQAKGNRSSVTNEA